MVKKLAQINIVCNGSTGKIMREIQKESIKKGYDTISFYGRGKGFEDLPSIKIGNFLSFFIHGTISTVFGYHGHSSKIDTYILIKKLKKYNPDVIHLHNIHGFYLNYSMLFNYLKNGYKGKIVWTLHDCWSFTGHCASFTIVDCNKWKKQCYKCPQKNSYPPSLFFDHCYKEYINKREKFNGLNNLTLTTPSDWLRGLVSQSYLKNYKIKTINNFIDFNIFCKKEENLNLVKEKYNIPKNKKIYLGVSSIWNNKKGLSILIDMSKYLMKNEAIVLVGLTKSQIEGLPSNIIGIERTDNQLELSSIYNIADVFVNPSLEETFSLVTLEAIGCGTPVVVMDNSAVQELILDSRVGKIVSTKNYNAKNILSIVRKINKKIPSIVVDQYISRYNVSKIYSQIYDIYEE